MSLLRRGDWEALRWRLARVLLRWAGALLARSHADTLAAQTSTGLQASYLSPSSAGPGFPRFPGQVVLTASPPESGNLLLGNMDAHGLLLQLAAASYAADREAER